MLCGTAISLVLVFVLRLAALLRAAQQHRDEIEAWLSLGATPSRAHLTIGQTAVRESLLPNLDQIRSTGLVTLPGAFVGAPFGGASARPVGRSGPG